MTNATNANNNNNDSVFANNKSLAIDTLRQGKNGKDILAILDTIVNDVKTV